MSGVSALARTARMDFAIGLVRLVGGFIFMVWTHLLCHDCNESSIGCSSQIPPQIPFCWLPMAIGFFITFAGAYKLIRSSIILFRLWRMSRSKRI